MSPHDNPPPPALQIERLCATSAAGLDAAGFNIGAATIALRLGDSLAAYESLEKSQEALLDAATAAHELAGLLRAMEGGEP